MDERELLNISPIDGRYHSKVAELGQYFSEYALMKFRIYVEVEYFIAMTELPIAQLKDFDSDNRGKLRNIYKKFNIDDCQQIKATEAKINHDVKAVEYFIKEKINLPALNDKLEFIHFGLTSQDINNTAIPLSLKEFVNEILTKKFVQLQEMLAKFSDETKEISLLAHTHGQPASPTKLGKEIKVFWERIGKQLSLLETIPFSAKFGGATGNFNAHLIAYPQVNWPAFGNEFVNGILGLERSQTTTQIEHYDNMAALFQNYGRINTILIDFCRDIWTYVSMNYFKQKLKAGEIGSSAMPHKVNPIDFENAEGNLGF
jgi:adenylosuccinate lyase